MAVALREKLSPLVEDLIRRLCLDNNQQLGQIVWEHIQSGGKRLRSRLALSTVEALNGPVSSAVGWAAACELLHNASLIHDDIQDGDTFRRGKPAIWARYGTSQAINAGDLCIALAYAAIETLPISDSLRWALTTRITHSSRAMVCGQSAEFSLLSMGVPTWAAYAEAVQGKTSALFSLPIEGAALIAGRNSQEAAALADTCNPFGLLFQIQDDLLDLYGSNGREMPASDLAQFGKVSALVVEHLQLHPEDLTWLLGIVNAPRDETPREAINQVVEKFITQGAVAAVWKRIDAIQANLLNSLELSREPALRILVQTFIADVLRPISHTRPRMAS